MRLTNAVDRCGVRRDARDYARMTLGKSLYYIVFVMDFSCLGMFRDMMRENEISYTINYIACIHGSSKYFNGYDYIWLKAVAIFD